jgi:apolipoprotein N-acyltransferase
VRDTSGREIFVDGFLTQKLMLGAQGLTFYTRFGDWFIIICLLLAFFGAVSYYSRKR